MAGIHTLFIFAFIILLFALKINTGTPGGYAVYYISTKILCLFYVFNFESKKACAFPQGKLRTPCERELVCCVMYDKLPVFMTLSQFL